MLSFNYLLDFFLSLRDCAQGVKRVHTLHSTSAERPPQSELHVVPTVVMPLDADMYIDDANGRHLIKRGEAMLIAPGVWHQHFAVRKGLRFYQQGFTGHASDVVCGNGSDHWVTYVPTNPSLLLCEEILVADDEATRCAKFTELIQTVLDEPFAPLQQRPRAFAAMLSYIYRNGHRAISCADVIAQSGLSNSRAQVLFKECMGRTILQELEERRLCDACQRLLFGAEILGLAERCGFKNQRALTAAFRRSFGLTAAQWLRQEEDAGHVRK